MWIIYRHTNKINGKSYIGQTTLKTDRRWRNNGTGYRNSVKFWNAIQKYGWDNFEHIIIDQIYNQELADIEEKLQIINFNSVKNGYNIKDGGIHGKPSEETKKKMSESHKRKTKEEHPMYGKRHTKESKNKMSETNKGKHYSHTTEFKLGFKQTEETKNKISKANKGKVISEDQRKKISEANKDNKNALGRKLTEKQKENMSIKMTGVHKNKTWKVINGKRVWIIKDGGSN